MTDAFRRTCLAVRGAVLALLLLMPSAANAATVQEATTFVTKLVNTAINDVIGAKISTAEREERFRKLFVQAADIPGIAAFVVGREWRGASASQKQEFVQLFEDVSILTWISHLDEYQGVHVDVTGGYQDKSDFFVESQVKTQDGKPIPIVWRVQERKGGELKLIDVVIEANSMLINTRKQYASVMRRDGGLNGLMTALAKMRDDLRAGKQPAPLPEG